MQRCGVTAPLGQLGGTYPRPPTHPFPGPAALDVTHHPTTSSHPKNSNNDNFQQRDGRPALCRHANWMAAPLASLLANTHFSAKGQMAPAGYYLMVLSAVLVRHHSAVSARPGAARDALHACCAVRQHTAPCNGDVSAPRATHACNQFLISCMAISQRIED